MNCVKCYDEIKSGQFSAPSRNAKGRVCRVCRNAERDLERYEDDPAFLPKNGEIHNKLRHRARNDYSK